MGAGEKELQDTDLRDNSASFTSPKKELHPDNQPPLSQTHTPPKTKGKNTVQKVSKPCQGTLDFTHKMGLSSTKTENYNLLKKGVLASKERIAVTQKHLYTPVKNPVTTLDSFTVYNMVRGQPEGITPKQLSKACHASLNAIYSHLKRLKASKAITRLDYGVWKVQTEYIMENPQTLSGNPEGQSHNPGIPAMSLHDVWFSVQVPVTTFWEKRRVRFSRLGVDWVPLSRAGQTDRGELFKWQGSTVECYPKSLIIVISEAFLGSRWEDVKPQALGLLKEKLLSLEAFLGLRLAFGDGYHIFWTKRHHYAKTRDRFAAMRKEQGKKLYVKFANPEHGTLVVDWSSRLAHDKHFEQLNGDPKFFDDKIVSFFTELESSDFSIKGLMNLVKTDMDGRREHDLRVSEQMAMILLILKRMQEK